ncbi:MAG: hypothetical protein K8T20_08205 [Planctomycetes bacterium]|nr:hypothetical protein [Planctomycetota bacterium]
MAATVKTLTPILVAVLLAGCRSSAIQRDASDPDEPHDVETAAQAERPGPLKDAIASWNKKTEEAKLADVTTYPVAGRPDLVGAICDYDPGWFGFMAVYGLENGAVAWQASCEVQPGEQSVHSMRSVVLKRFANPVFEVFGKTHMGNGDLYLYELRDRKLVLILETRAVDYHTGDRYFFKDGLLSPRYRDINLDGFDDLELTGTVVDQGEDIYDPDPESKEGFIGKGPASEFPCRKVFYWDPSAGHYLEIVDYRAGLDDQPEFDYSANMGR